MDDVVGMLHAVLGSRRAARDLLRGTGTLRRALETPGTELATRYRVAPRHAAAWEALRLLRRNAALEAAARGPPLSTPGAIHAVVAPLFEGRRREVFFVLPVDAGLQLVCPPVLVGEGGPDFVTLAPRRVFEVLFREDASAAFLAHNHPSGDPTPSFEDRRLTDRLVELGTGLGLRILDHLVVGEGRSQSVVGGVEVGR